MIKLYALLPRRPDITIEQFHRHWSTVHREHALRIERIRRYSQAHRVRPDLGGVTAGPWEGIAEVWFDSAESAAAQRTDPQYTEYAHVDEPNFIDMAAIQRVLATHRLVLDPGEQTTKALLFALRPDAASEDEFAAAWWALAERLPGACEAATGLALAVGLPTAPDAQRPAYDAVAELWWPDLETCRESWAGDGPRVLELLATVGEPGTVRAFLAEELRVIWPPG